MRRLVWSLLLFGSTALAGRPPDAIEQDRRAAEAEVKDLERRARALDEQTAERNDRLKRRLRALYKLSSGGYLRLLAGSNDAATLEARQAAVGRVLKRDLDELQAVREEARSVVEDHARHAERMARASALSAEAQAARAEEPTGLERLMGQLTRPVPGAIAHPFGVTMDPELKTQVSRRGVDLESHRGQPVRAVAEGRVAWIGEVPGYGRGVAVDHGDGYVSLIARFRDVDVQEGEPVQAGTVLGQAAGRYLYMELAQGGTPVDPVPWLAR